MFLIIQGDFRLTHFIIFLKPGPIWRMSGRKDITAIVWRLMSSLFLHLQIIAGHSNDRLTLAFAQKLEMKFGGYVPPCEIIR